MGSSTASHTYTQQFLTGWSKFSDLLPQYARPDTWLTAIRVMVCFITPLLVGALLGDFENAFPIGLSSGMIALADPRGSTERRSLTLFAAIIGGAILLNVGHLVAGHLIGVLILCCFLGFSMGMLENFGMSGVRAGFFWISAAFMGSTAYGTDPLISTMDIFSGGLWALCVALTYFKTPSWQRKTFKRRWLDFKLNLKNELKMLTPIGRMAYRIMIATGIAVSVTYLLGLNNPEWAAAAAMALFFPLSPFIYKRGARFIIATTMAIVICFIFITYVKNLVAIAIFVGVMLFVSTAMRETNYAAFSFTNTIFYVLVIMLGSGVGGVDLLRLRLINVAIGLAVALVIASLTLPARERIALLVEMDLPLPAKEHIDDPIFARIRAEQVIQSIYHPHEREHGMQSELWMEGYDVVKEMNLSEKKRNMRRAYVLSELKDSSEELEDGAGVLELVHENEKSDREKKRAKRERRTQRYHKNAGTSPEICEPVLEPAKRGDEQPIEQPATDVDVDNAASSPADKGEA